MHKNRLQKHNFQRLLIINIDTRKLLDNFERFKCKFNKAAIPIYTFNLLANQFLQWRKIQRSQLFFTVLSLVFSFSLINKSVLKQASCRIGKFAYICEPIMIVFLQGKYVKKTPAFVWMDVNGVGYEVNISLNTYSEIQNLTQGQLLTHLQIKEDGHSLFGFFEETERNMFLLLISVSGVGASTARMMLSSMKPDEISNAIANDDEKTLERIKGIGAKSAKRLILELKDKVTKSKSGETLQPITYNNIENDALNALISLGIARNAAFAALQKTVKNNKELSLEDLIKLTLKNI